VALMLGFIGVGEMGERMCRNLVRKSGCPVVIYDLREEPVQALVKDGAVRANSIAKVVEQADVIFLSLPGGREVRAVCCGEQGIIASCRPGQIVVDTSTNSPSSARDIAERFMREGVLFADAPVARTREAAAEGTLSIMVGAEPELFLRIKPLLELIGTSITHCGGVGCGEIAKIINNLLVFENVLAAAEALTLGRRAGIDDAVLVKVLQEGSADSFVLRNHVPKAMLPGAFRKPSFGASYVLKDLSYALQLGRETDLPLAGAELARRFFELAADSEFATEYFPAIIKIVERQNSSAAAGPAANDVPR
jgi:3-hydroxyisobutyrate dehydrogenase-like beta-hydroxyacid dehydrogenase